ncbi:MAG: ADP-ribosylglycohydrolase family protein [Cyclobacteriaceae bacterium]|nr:ADP-ribosylglycohydrolase family protein [Cyclobacteriaceae bacterium]
MKRSLTAFLFLILAACGQKQTEQAKTDDGPLVISKAILKDKIKGAWAAQTIGVTFGAPIEFKYNTTMVQDNQKIEWNDTLLANEFKTKPGTYDDIYMDLTFVQVLEDKGMDATPQQFADAIGNADYKLWFANQMARYNIQNGLTPPQSGHWLNNPCADDIDFQIEADFAGLMSPGMINSGIEICDRVGHIMNYGDGYYGGVYISGLYSLALAANSTSEIESIAKEALKTIPAESKFAQCINDVIQWHKENPDDWKATWYKVNRKWSIDTSSPLGIFKPFNIDAKINAAWVLVGLLYGNGDFTRTFEIATRCGDDADCNPASAGGILAAIVGYNKIPDFWKKGIDKVEQIPFMGTSISLTKAYDLSYQHAEKMIAKNGGEIRENEVVIKRQVPKTVPLEVSFKDHYPVALINPKISKTEISFEFDGVGFALVSPPNLKNYDGKNPEFNTEMYIDDKLVEKARLSTKETNRRFTPFWKYQLPKGKHKVVVKILNPIDYAQPEINYVIIFDDKPSEIKL